MEKIAIEQYENDYKLKHVVLRNLSCWNTEEEKLEPVILDFFGHCYEMTIIATKEKEISIITSEFELVFRATPSKANDKFHVTLNRDYDKVFVMSSQNLNLLEQHYQEMNQHIPAMRETFKENAYSIVVKLLNDDELVKMGKNFVDEFPVVFYTDSDYLISTEILIETVNFHIGKLVFLSSQELREHFKAEESDFIDSNLEGISSYIEDDLMMFTNILKEKTHEADIYLAYLFIYKITIMHLSDKWEQDYKEYFLDIKKIDLDTAIERYCSIEDVNHKNTVSAGIFIYYLINQGKFENGNQNYLDCVNIFVPKLNKILDSKKYKRFVEKLKAPNNEKITLDDVDLMGGQEFENFIAKLFTNMGYETKLTKATGDQGIDIVISKNGNKIGIQAKCYSGNVGNSAIQEVVAGINYYQLDKGMVITNSFFTESAQQLAQANSIVLWDRNILKEKIEEILNSR